MAPSNVQELCFVHRLQRSHKRMSMRSFMLGLLPKPSKCLILFSIFVIAQTSFSLGFFQSRLTNESMGFIWPLKHHENGEQKTRSKGAVCKPSGGLCLVPRHIVMILHINKQKNRAHPLQNWIIHSLGCHGLILYIHFGFALTRYTCPPQRKALICSCRIHRSTRQWLTGTKIEENLCLSVSNLLL